ncbi:BatD family protein [Bosea sp. BK604]|uniref:BatD family protein n=1 Tax=Bosea sp. BK604 TaxID=2512180 RepID=UPI00104E4BA1|nr:BatD family protein [Bosea sp. BK604]TCR63447.1 oxygen tolerance protein BatD [Bosea sp. BK604]
MRIVAAFALLIIPAMALAQAPARAPIIRSTLDPAEGIVIGQPVRLDVLVLFPGDMPHPPLVSMPEAPGAQILRFETQATTTRDRIDGQDYVGQNFEFILFPRRGGEIAIPAPSVTMLDRSGDPTGSAKGETKRINVTVPPGVDPSGPVLVADRVGVEQDWSPDPGAAQFKAGSALVRTIRRQADGVPALGMAEFGFTAPEGVRVYADPPMIEDRSNRGSVEGHRTDKVTYVFEKAGRYELPALSQPWWSLADKRARTETLPGVTVTVAAGATASPVQARSSLGPAWLAAILALLGLAAVLVLFRSRLVHLYRNAAQRYHSSEAAARRALLHAARAGEPAATYQALRQWLQRLPADERQRVCTDERLAGATARLESSLFGSGGRWSREAGAALAAALAQADGRSRSAPVPERGLLPPLNPST